jgi:hypothetical protein
VVAIVLLEGWFLATTEPLTGLPYLQPTADAAAIVVKRQLLAEATPEIVFIGDSSCTVGLIPSLVQEATGRRTLNLGTLATYTTSGYCELGHVALAKEPPPAALVLAVLPQALGVTEPQAREFGLLARAAVAYPALRQGDFQPGVSDWRDWFFLKHRLNRFPPKFGGSYQGYLTLLRAERGYFNEGEQYTEPKRVHSTLELDPFALTPIRKLVAAAATKNVPLYLWLSPNPSNALASSLHEVLPQRFQAMQEALPSDVWLQTEIPAWPAERFSSQTHLNHEGAELNSKLLAEMLRKRLSR